MPDESNAGAARWGTVGSVLFGRDRGRSKRLLLIPVGLFVLTSALVEAGVLSPSPMGSVSGTAPYVSYAYWLALVLLAAVPAYLNDGLVVCLALVFGVVLAFVATYGVAVSSEPTLAEYAFLVLGFGAGTTVVFGLPGFLLGAGARRVRRYAIRRTASDG